MTDPVALAAMALDAAVGWPDALYRRVSHPVGTFAGIIETCERHWNQPWRAEPTRRMLGVLTVLILLVTAGSITFTLQALCVSTLGPWSWIALAALAWPALAQRSLYDHVRPIAVALEAGDIAAARNAVSMICGRDTRDLDGPALARAGIESLAESFCDGIAAPLFWLIVGGLPGVWIYKAINTADSLIGHREPRWRAFGWAAARTDDVLNLLPARIGAVMICLAGRGGWTTMWRDHARHASPNAGWTEAAMAGVLHLRLAGPVSYDGQVHAKAWIGDDRADASAADVRRAMVVYVRACLLLGAMAAVLSLRG